MPRKAFYVALMLGLTFTASCGDKLDPAAPDETQETIPVTGGSTGTPTGNGNSTGGTSAEPNSTVTNPNGTTANPNVTTPTPTPTPTTGLCGTTAATISYATHIAPLVVDTCSSCHGAGGIQPVMTTLSNTKLAFSSYGAQAEIDAKSMPRGQTLDKNEICLFDTWATTNFSK